MPRVTVAICTYNRSHYLRQAIQSVVEQTYKDMKIIVYDNGSTDNTCDVVKEFGEFGVGYVKFPQNRRDAFNVILDSCDTEYIVIFHDDDIMLPHMIETEVHEMDKRPNAVLCGQKMPGIVIDERGNTLDSPVFSGGTKIFHRQAWIEDNIDTGHSTICCPSVMFRMSLMNEFGLRFRLECGPAADWLMWLEANSKCDVVIMNSPVMKYRSHSGSDSVSQTRTSKFCESHVHIAKWLSENGYENRLEKMIDYFILNDIIPLGQRVMQRQAQFKEVEERLFELERKYGWKISDKSNIAKGLLLPAAIGVRKKNVSVLQYLKFRSKIKKHFGSTPSFFVEAKNFLKHVVLRRLTCAQWKIRHVRVNTIGEHDNAK